AYASAPGRRQSGSLFERVMKIASGGHLLGSCHRIFTPLLARMADGTLLAWLCRTISSVWVMQTSSCGSTAGTAFASALVQTTAAIAVTPMIFITVSTS